MLLHGETCKVLVPDILVVTQHAWHDTVGEVVKARCRENVLRPVPFLLILWPRSFVVLLTNPHHDAYRIIIEPEPNRMRPRSHLNGVPHVVLEPIIHSTLHLELAIGVLATASSAKLRKRTWSKIEMNQLA